MKKTSAIFMSVMVASLVASFVVAQPVPPPGLKKVVHDSTLKGSGTTPAPLGLALCSANQVWAMNSGGTAWACATNGGGTPTGSLSVTVNPDPGGTINLSTGTVGWIYNNIGNTGRPYATTPTANVRWKLLDNGLAANLQIVGVNNTTSSGNYTQGTSFTTTSTDDIFGGSLAANASGTIFANVSSGITYGWSLHVPVNTSAHTFKMFSVVHGGTATITAHLEDASASDATNTFSAGGGVNVFKELDVAVTAGSPTFVDISVIVTSSVGVSEVGFSAITES